MLCPLCPPRRPASSRLLRAIAAIPWLCPSSPSPSVPCLRPPGNQYQSLLPPDASPRTPPPGNHPPHPHPTPPRPRRGSKAERLAASIFHPNYPKSRHRRCALALLICAKSCRRAALSRLLAHIEKHTIAQVPHREGICMSGEAISTVAHRMINDAPRTSRRASLRRWARLA